MKLKTTEFFALLFTALVTGVFWGTWFTLTRSLQGFSGAEFIHIGKTIIANVVLPMSIIMPLTLLLQLAAVWQSRSFQKTAFYLYSVAFLLMVLTLLITLVVEVPIDNQIKIWTEQSLPENWQVLRHQWDLFHTLRTFTSIASLGIFTAGMTRRMQ